ncbi:MAG: hypothetical protein NTY09_08870 [bacterium]|nr:hypothetical protein [bacterium]
MIENSKEISFYIAWQIERAAYIGLFLELLGLFAFLSLWWHQDRAWRYLRWIFVIYFFAMMVIPALISFLYGWVSEDPMLNMKAFLVRSGLAGIIISAGAIGFLIFDYYKKLIGFDHFSPESWTASKPNFRQWFGLAVAFAAIWSPFVPYPGSTIQSLFTYGFPTSFGVTLTPTIIFLCGLISAGSRHPSSQSLIIPGILIVISALVVDPITIHALSYALVGIIFIIFGILNSRQKYRISD